MSTVQITESVRPGVERERGCPQADPISFAILGPLLDAIRRVAAQNGIDLPALLLASFQLCIQRYRMQDSVNTVVMRALARSSRLGTTNSSMVLVDKDRDESLDSPFVAIARSAHAALSTATSFIDRGRAEPRQQPAAALFVWRELEGEDALPVSAQDDDRGDLAKASLLLEITQAADALHVRFDLQSDLFPHVGKGDFADSYRALLQEVVDDPDRPVSRMQMLSATQRHRLLKTWNDTRVEHPAGEQVELLFDQQARRSPDAIALRCQGESATYRQLQRRSNQLAHRLLGLGVGPDRLVAICTDRSIDMVVGLLGILKAGAAYVPLDPHYPVERLAFMLEDAAVAAVVTQEQWIGQLSKLAVPTVLLDAERARLDGESPDAPMPQAGPEDLAYVIYTSGSTGKPKGVAVRRGGLVNFLHAMQRNLCLTPSDALLAVTTISFDIAEMELYLPLLCGARVVIATRAEATDPGQLTRLLNEENVTFLQCTPATWRMLLDSGWAGKPDLTMLCGGEAMTRELADALLQRGACLWNMYGPTETTVWSAMCMIEPGAGPISIGRPIDNTEIYILDDRLQLVPVGTVGELHIGGTGLARGYLHRPELTAEKFIENPFAQKDDTEATAESGLSPRIYKTGDLARYWPDGRIECLGRVDYQVKIRGFRVELPEIEARLAAHPQVGSCAVIPQTDSHGDVYLAAYWAARKQARGPQLKTSDLRQFLAESLPGHMIPSAFVRLDRLPLTPNGKIDRKTLPSLNRRARVLDTGYVAPRTDVERKLAGIWQELLDLRTIGVKDDFFAIGGHSLAAARMVARIETVFGMQIPLATLLSASTIESLARVIDGRKQQDSGVLVTFSSKGLKPPLFLVAGVGGHVLIFRELAQLLGEDRPIHALQGIGLDGREPSLPRMQDIADRYIREIMCVQPQGPYFVGGWSMGGIIAYEIAQQMLQRGMPLGRLIVIDAYPPWATSAAERFRIHLASFRRRSWRQKIGYLTERVVHRFEVARRRMGVEHVDEVSGPMADLIRLSSLAQFEALRVYRPRPFDGNLALLRADQTREIRDPRSADPCLGWTTLIRGRIDVFPIPGSHTGIFVGDNVRALAATLRKCIDR